MRKQSTRCFTLLLLIYVLVFTSIVTIPITVSSTESDIIAALLELSDIISNLPDEAFENPSAAENQRNTLCNKIDAVINKVEAGAYGAAVSKLENDIKKTIVSWIIDPWETELLEKVDEIIRLIPPVHDIAVTSVTISPTEVYLGNQAYIGVTVANEGTESETFDVYVYIDQDTTHIGDEITLGPITTVLNAGVTATLGFIWDTTGVAEGTYTVSAEAVVALDDYPANNLFTNGTVTVLPNVGWIDGTVTDATTSDPLVGATVEVDGNLATTDTTGYYKIELSPGDYTVTASMTGFITQFKSAHVDAGTTTTVDFALGAVTHTLEVISNPISGIAFTVDGTTHTTPWSDSLPERTHTIVMPSTWGIYDFDHWEDASTNPARTVSLNADKTVTAYYVKRQWTLNVNSDPMDGVEFTVDGVTHPTPWSNLLDEGSYTVVMPSTWTVGTDVYNFNHWEDASADPTRVVTLVSDMTITAYYVLAPKYWTLTINSDTISGIDFTLDGTTHTTPWSDSLPEETYTVVMPSTWTIGTDVYNFNHWEDTSTNPTRTIHLAANTTITAYYEYVAVSHKLTIGSDPITGIEFTINGATQITLWTGDLAEGSHTVVMPATWTTASSDVYNFNHWEDASTNPTRTISLTAEMVITAYYMLAPKYWTLTIDSEPVTGIEFTIDSVKHTTPWSDSLSEGPHSIVMPSYWTISTNKYSFDQWEDSSTNPTRTISLTANTTVTATYKLCVDPVASFTFSPTEPIAAETVTFNASPSYDPDGTIVSYSWDFGDGNAGTGITTTHAYTTADTYTITLTVTDNDGLTDDETKIITIYARPVASFTYSPKAPASGETVNFNAFFASHDPDGTIVSYSWDFGDETTGTGKFVAHVYAEDGTYTITLTVTDNDDLTDTATSNITVAPPELKPPVASFTYSPESPVVDETVTLNASPSYDPDGTIVSYSWDFGDGNAGTGITTTHAYTTAGTYTVTLTVTDNDGLTNSTSADTTVSPIPEHPVASFTYEPIDPFLNQNVTFDASASTPNGGHIVNYEWDFGDGTTGTDMNVTHAYAAYGNFTVTLNVTDSEGFWDVATDTVRVYPHPPIASFTFSPLTPYTDETVMFDATESYDPDGNIVWYYWSFGDNTYLNTTDQIAHHPYIDDKTYTVALTVSDNEGLSRTASAIVTVPNRPPIAIFTESAETVLTDLAIRFDASDSYDLDGSILSYFWDFGDGTNATGVSVDHAYVDDGIYTVTLTVTDDDGKTTSKSAIKTVLNRPPVALFSDNATIVFTGEIIHFNASVSNDPDGSIISYLWNFGDGANATGVTVNHAYEDDDTYTVTLTVTDDDGKTTSKSVAKTISNRPPMALFTDSATMVGVGELIRFDASDSYDLDGSILSYFWDFGDGADASMCVLLDHAYTEDGNYTVTLTVTDDDGAWASTSVTKTVKTELGWPLYLVGGIALGIAGLTGIAIYIIFRRRKKLGNETTAPENKPFITLYVPRGFFAGYEKLTKAADNSVVLRRT